MSAEEGDEFVTFAHVLILGSTAQTLHCRIGDRVVWIPRVHIMGRTSRAGEYRELRVRRWLARDRSLIDAAGVAIGGMIQSVASRASTLLHLVQPRGERVPC